MSGQDARSAASRIDLAGSSAGNGLGTKKAVCRQPGRPSDSVTSASSCYGTIVADPPWDHSDGTGYSFGHRDPRGRSGKHGPSSHGLPYTTLSIAEIAALRLPAAADADLYLWTTNRYLRDAYTIAEAWNFTPSTALVWCKPQNQGLFGGRFLSNVEFCLFARRGQPQYRDKCGSRWFTWPRGAHSAKPEAFYDLVETVSVGPYLDMFSRRARLGWDTWGDEALHGTELIA